METDDQAMQIEAARLQFMPDVEGILRDYRPGDEILVVAARLTGKRENSLSRRQAAR